MSRQFDAQVSRGLLHGTGDRPSASCYSPHLDPGNSTSLSYYRALYDYLRLSDFAASDRVGSVEVVPAGSLPDDAPVDPGGPQMDLALLHLSSIFSFSESSTDEVNGEPTLSALPSLAMNRYSGAAGLLLAIHHFNNGDGSVVREIKNIHERCPVRFAVDFYDAEMSSKAAMDAATRQILSRPDRPPSAFFGAYRSFISVPLAALSGVYGIPQISPRSTSTELDDPKRFPYFSRLTPSDAGTARVAVDFLRERSPDEMRFMGVLYLNDAFGSAYHLAIKEAAEYVGAGDEDGDEETEEESDERGKIRVRGVPFSPTNLGEIEFAVQTLAETGYRVFFGVFYTKHYEQVMEAAIKHGIAGPGYLWILSDGISNSFLNGKSYPKGSPLAVASQGIGILYAEGGMKTEGGNTGFDRFSRAWYRQTKEVVDYYNCVGHPATNSLDDPSIYYQAEDDAFEERLLPPKAGSVFFYDSVIAMGLAACSLLDEEGRDPSAYFTGAELLDSFLRQEFDGATGFVSVDPTTHSRDPSTAFFVMYNANGSTEDGVTTFNIDKVSHTVHKRGADSDTIAWVDIEGKEFVFSDNTANVPFSLPPVTNFERNYLSRGVRAVGLLLACIIFATSIFFSVWTFRHRKERVVRASQPKFLQMICFGTLIMAATIVTLSIDDSIASQEGCSVACMLSPWFLAIGFVVAFSSLFAKEWRINKIFHNPQLNRMKVTGKDVALPCVVLLALNIIVLTVWTVASPLTWNRSIVGTFDRYGRSIETLGACHGETKEWAPYVAILLFLNGSLVALANFQAYRARKISTEFSESRYVAIIMASVLQAAVIGLPLAILVADDPTVSFIVRSFIIFVICMSMLLVMFIPKMIYMRDARKEAIKKESRKQERARRMKSMLKRSRDAEQTALNPSLERQSSEASDVSTESAARVLHHPKTENNELQDLKAQLEQAKVQEQRLREELISLKDTTCTCNQSQNAVSSGENFPAKNDPSRQQRKMSVTFASETSDSDRGLP